MKYLPPIFLIALGCIGLLMVSLNAIQPADEESPPAASQQAASSVDTSGLVILKFGAPWCPPCRMIDKELEKLEGSDFPAEVRKVNVDERPDLAAEYGVTGIPRMILMHNGRVLGDEMGFMSADQLSNWVHANVSDDMLAGSEPVKPSGPQTNPYFD